MTTFIFKNNAQSTIAGPISSSATSVTLATGTGAKFPSPGAGQQFPFTLNDAATGLIYEITYCTARSGDTLTIARGQEGTTAVAWNTGDLGANLITAGVQNAFFQNATYQGQPTQGYFSFVGSTEVLFTPLGGDLIVIDGNVYNIPSSGVIGFNTNSYVNGVAAQNLAASSIYDVFVFNNAGTLTFDFWLTTSGTHMADTTSGNVGVEVRSNSGTPDSTRSYVGKVATNSSNKFQSQGVGTISWFNRKLLVSFNQSLSTFTTSSTSIVEISSTVRAPFLIFGDDMVTITAGSISGSISSSSFVFTAWAGIDSALTGLADFDFQSSNVFPSIVAVRASAYNTTPTEGSHYGTLLGQVNNASATASFSDLVVAVNLRG